MKEGRTRTGGTQSRITACNQLPFPPRHSLLKVCNGSQTMCIEGRKTKSWTPDMKLQHGCSCPQKPAGDAQFRFPIRELGRCGYKYVFADDVQVVSWRCTGDMFHDVDLMLLLLPFAKPRTRSAKTRERREVHVTCSPFHGFRSISHISYASPPPSPPPLYQTKQIQIIDGDNRALEKGGSVHPSSRVIYQ